MNELNELVKLIERAHDKAESIAFNVGDNDGDVADVYNTLNKALNCANFIKADRG